MPENPLGALDYFTLGYNPWSRGNITGDSQLIRLFIC